MLLTPHVSSRGKGKGMASDVETKLSPQRGDANSTSPSRNTRRSARRQKAASAVAGTGQTDVAPTDAGTMLVSALCNALLLWVMVDRNDYCRSPKDCSCKH